MKSSRVRCFYHSLVAARRHPVLLLLALFSLAALASAARAASDTPVLNGQAATAPNADPASGDAKMNWEVSLTYAAGIDKVIDQMETNFGVSKRSAWPVALKFGGYDQLANGWCFGGSIGPCELFVVDQVGSGFSGRNNNYIIPVTIDARYILGGYGKEKVYVRAGLTQPLTSGDYIGSGKLGPTVAIGSEFWHGSSVSLGMEVGYDGSKVEVKAGHSWLDSSYSSYPAVKVAPVGLNASFFVRF